MFDKHLMLNQFTHKIYLSVIHVNKIWRNESHDSSLNSVASLYVIFNFNWFVIVLMKCTHSLFPVSGIHKSQESDLLSTTHNHASPDITPSKAMLPLQAPSPFMPFTYTKMPKLSGNHITNILKKNNLGLFSLVHL